MGDTKLKVFATLHPAHIMRQQENWPLVIYDLHRAQIQSAFPEVRRRPCNYVLDASLAEHGELIANLARRHGVLDFDIETHGPGPKGGLDPRTGQIICNGFAVDEETAYVFRWTPPVAEWFNSLASDPGIEIEGQNIESFDIPFCEEKGITFVGPTWDTLQAFHLTNSDQPKNLGHIMSLHTDMEYHKDTASDNLFLYNAKDVLGQRRSAVSLRKELKDLGMEDLMRTVCRIQPKLRKMNKLGMKQDELLALRWDMAMDMKAREYEEKLRAVFGQSFNAKSSKDVMHVLYDVLGLPVQKIKDQKTKQMRPTANAEAIEKLAAQYDDPLLQGISKVRSLDHTRNTYINVEKDENNYVHPRFGTAKAATGRLNSWDPNFQNIPLELRQIYVPDSPDHVFMSADWSQVETRIAMFLSGDEKGLEILASGEDWLVSMAADAYQVSKDQCRKGGSQEHLRYMAKFIWYGMAYGRGAKDIAKQTKRSQTDIETFMKKIFKLFPQWHEWRETFMDTVERDSCLINPFGRRRWWYTRQVTEMYNFPIQSTGADMMYVSVCDVDDDLTQHAKASTIRATVHDELVLVVAKDEARIAKEILEQRMNRIWPEIVAQSRHPENCKKYFPEGFRAPAEVTVGNNWMESKDGNKDLYKELFG
jgi:DNA polymerase-1